MTTLLLFMAAYFVADFFVGMYHMLTDKGWNIRQQVSAFREHHEGALVFDVKPVFFALPVLAVAFYFGLPFVAAFAFFSGLSEFAHYSAHRPQSCPRFVRWLQQARVIISPAAHARHHDEVFDRSYCVFSGWADCLVDRIARFIPTKSVSHHSQEERLAVRYSADGLLRRRRPLWRARTRRYLPPAVDANFVPPRSFEVEQ